MKHTDPNTGHAKQWHTARGVQQQTDRTGKTIVVKSYQSHDKEVGDWLRAERVGPRP